MALGASVGAIVAHRVLTLGRGHSSSESGEQATGCNTAAIELADADLSSEGGLTPGEKSPRIRPDVLLGPVLVIMIGLVVDRARESYAQETVTAVAVSTLAAVALLLGEAAGFPLLGRAGPLIFSWFTILAFLITNQDPDINSVWTNATAWSLVGYILLRGAVVIYRAPRAKFSHGLLYAMDAVIALWLFLNAGRYILGLLSSDGWEALHDEPAVALLVYSAAIAGLGVGTARFSGRVWIGAAAAALAAVGWALNGNWPEARQFGVTAAVLFGLASHIEWRASSSARLLRQILEEPLPIKDESTLELMDSSESVARAVIFFVVAVTLSAVIVQQVR